MLSVEIVDGKIKGGQTILKVKKATRTSAISFSFFLKKKEKPEKKGKQAAFWSSKELIVTLLLSFLWAIQT